MNPILKSFFLRYGAIALILTGTSLCRADIPAPPNAAYQRVWSQDFTALKKLEVAPHEMGAGTWIAHTPSYTDWFAFQDPGEPYHPFALTKEGLVIRVQKDGHDPNNWFAGYSGGLLSSMDGSGKGFAQQYGYFEAAMQTPGGANTWPGFWLLDAPSLTDKTLPDGAEIDISESYGNWGTGKNQTPPGNPNINTTNWHRWGHNGAPGEGGGSYVARPGMTTGFHTYGVDIEPDTTIFYFDRKETWRMPTFTAEKRPLFVLINLALGGGTHNNADGSAYDWSLTPIPSDLKVKYIAVWASPNSPNYRGKPAPPAQLSAVAGEGKVMLEWAAGGTSVNLYRGLKAGGGDATLIASGVTKPTYLDTGLQSGTPYYYSVEAVNAYGKSPRSQPTRIVPGADFAARAAYLKTDSATQGDWRQAYGGDGYAVFGDSIHYPTYAKVSASTDNTFTWRPTTEVRALQRGSRPSEKIAAELHADPLLTLDIAFTDGKPHQAALYFMDYDHKGEVNKVEIKDATFGDVLDTRLFSSFAEGQYAVYTLQGHVRISVTNSAPRALNSQATISGLFFGGGGKRL